MLVALQVDFELSVTQIGLKFHYALEVKNPLFTLRKLVSLVPISHVNVMRREVEKIAKQTRNPRIKILDIGAGSAWYWEQLKVKEKSVLLEVTLLDAITLNNPESTSTQITYRRVVGTVPESLSAIPSNSFDFVLACDLIEHLPKESGYKLLYEIDRISIGSSMIFTPNGFVWQPPSINNPFNAHISGWKSSEIRHLGWKKVRGHTGLKILRSAYGRKIDFAKRWPFSELDALLTLVVFRFPRFAFAYSAIKNKKNPRIEEQDFQQ
jgi:hypothetical protein